MLGIALALAALAGSGSDSPSAVENGYVGTVQGTDAFVAIVSGDAEAVVYVCNGEEGISEWFEGSILDPRELSLTNEAGASVQAVYEDATWEGAVTLGDGSTHAITAVMANDGAGLYKVDDEAAVAKGVWAAWVVDNDGNERGAFRRSGVLATSTPRSSRSTFAVGRQATDGVEIIIVEEEPMGSSNA